MLDRLNGKIYLILGNHDLKNIRQGYINRFEHVAMQMHIEVNKQKIYLNHYPFYALMADIKMCGNCSDTSILGKTTQELTLLGSNIYIRHSMMSELTTITLRRYHLNKSKE